MGFWPLVFSADVIMGLPWRQPGVRGLCDHLSWGSPSRPLLPRPVKGRNSEDIPFKEDEFNESNGKW